MSELQLDKDLQIELHRKLEALESSTDLEGTALVSKTGLRIASSVGSSTDIDEHSASPAAIVSLANSVSMGLEYGKLSQIVVSGEDGYTILTTKQESEFMLLAHSKQQAKLGYYFHRLEKSFSELTGLLSNIQVGQANY